MTNYFPGLDPTLAELDFPNIPCEMTWRELDGRKTECSADADHLTRLAYTFSDSRGYRQWWNALCTDCFKRLNLLGVVMEETPL